MITSTTSGVWDGDDIYKKINAGYLTYDASNDPGELYSFGNNTLGALGQNNRTYYSSPTQVPGTQWLSIGGSYNSSFGLKSDGTLWAWGLLNSGQSGLSITGNRVSSPTQIPGTQWSKFEGGYGSILAIKSDNTLWAWGDNPHGQLGHANLIDYSSPTQVPGTQWSLISTNRTQTLGLRNDGTLWAWGINNTGQLGQNNRTYYSSPIQIPGTNWSTISSAYYRNYATKTDGTLWSWGRASYGTLGLNSSTIHQSSPTQIPGTNWASVPLSMSYNAFALKDDGTLWALGGYGAYGRMGVNDQISRSSPVQVPGTQWASISGSYYVTIATKTDGTAWSWGLSNHGQLGHNDLIQYSSPQQIPGTQWKVEGVGGYTGSFTFLLKNVS